MLSHHPFFEHFLESIVVILSVMCLSQNIINCGMTLMLLSLISLILVFPWTSEVPGHLCFAIQKRASEIPSYHILLWALQSCELICFMFVAISMLISFHSLHAYWVTLFAFASSWIAQAFVHIVRIYASYEANVFVKVFYRTQLLTELLEDKQ